MDINKYQKLCKKTANKYNDPAKEIACWGLGIAGEAGDVASCIKKTIYHKNDQRTGIRENLSDTMWYAAMICNFYGWDFEEILDENIAKLKKRYPKGFTLEKAKRNNGTCKSSLAYWTPKIINYWGLICSRFILKVSSNQGIVG